MKEHNPILPIIPKPASLKTIPGTYTLTPTGSISTSPEGERAAQLLGRLTGLTRSAEKGTVRFETDPQVQGAEAYRLTINLDGVCITASTPAGLFYGAQTLRQLLPAAVERGGLQQPVELPCLEIEDQPRFAYRGFMLDVSRHFFAPAEVKRVLDLLALQKINRFHWHLTDDQGWRIEIKRYPRLTEIGSQRKETQVDGWLFTKPVYDGRPYGGFYTQEDIREIVAYARDNFIEVIPEIGSPGHAAAAIAAYPQLSCSGQPIEVRSTFTSFSNPMCVGQEFTFEFLQHVFTEILDLFPSGKVHIGGDEVNKSAWKKCPHCQSRMKVEGLKNGHDLQAYFENRLVKALKAKGPTITAWNDVLHADLDKDVINQFWFFPGRKKTIAGLRQGRQTIVSEVTYLYLDYAFKAIQLARTYGFEPQFKEITDEQAQNILGIEAPLWTEYVYSRQRMDWQMFPRLLAVSEIAWLPKGKRDFQDFLARLEQFEKRLDALDVHYARRACYLKYPTISKIPPIFRMFARKHPAMEEYLLHHPSETRK